MYVKTIFDKYNYAYLFKFDNEEILIPEETNETIVEIEVRGQRPFNFNKAKIIVRTEANNKINDFETKNQQLKDWLQMNIEDYKKKVRGKRSCY